MRHVEKETGKVKGRKEKGGKGKVKVTVGCPLVVNSVVVEDAAVKAKFEVMEGTHVECGNLDIGEVNAPTKRICAEAGMSAGTTSARSSIFPNESHIAVSPWRNSIC